MDDRDYELISKMADQALDKAAMAKANAEKFTDLASQSASRRVMADAHSYRKVAAGYLNDYFYWIGHHNAYKGIAAGLALREVADQEINDTPACP